MIKVLLSCLVKFIQGSGAECIFIENIWCQCNSVVVKTFLLGLPSGMSLLAKMVVR